ncbi:type VI secretion system-associated FHA domain protein TagH [Photobacterium nomapromontoriensis]|uniref:type VI secretion system-associated FHA domain protein TagH n=1 Tax=Photobacterium nomapromontoriensis TaxID=2910237 RepID=UPI003D0D2FC6
MELTLSVVSYHRFTSDLEVKKSFLMNDKLQSYSIGRSQQCDWCLPDHERVISGTHARIDCESRSFTITDVSTNGVFINRSVTPLGKDNSHTLRDGDFLSFGDYEVEVSLSSLENDVFSGFDKPAENNRDPIGHFDFDNQDNQTVPEEWDFGISTTQLNPMATAPAAQNIEPVAIIPPSATPATQASSPVFTGNIEDSFIAPSKQNSDTDEDQDTLAIPEDWSVNILSEPTIPPPTPQVTPPKPDPTPASKPAISPVAEPRSAAVFTDKAHSREDVHKLRDEVRAEDYVLGQPATPPPVLHSTGSAQAMAAFIQGLGISHNMVPSENDEQWWFELGTSMQYLMTGLMDSLHHRTEFKQSNRLNQTLFKRQENNPLKFSASLEDAIHNLFNRKSTSFLPSDRAIKEAFSDIDSHEQALLAGVDGTVNGMMKLLSPESIAAKTQDQAFWGKLNPARSKAQNWANYEAMYQRLNEDLQNASNSFYLDDFVKAYEAHLKANKTKG